MTVRHDLLPRINSGVNHGTKAFSKRDLDRPLFYGLVLFQRVNVGTLCASLHRRGRNRNGILARVDLQACVHKLIRIQGIITIIKDCLQAKCSRIGIDLIVDRFQATVRDLLRVVAIPSLYLQPAAPHVLSHHWQVVLGQGEEDRNRLQLSNHQQSIRIGGMNHVARID